MDTIWFPWDAPILSNVSAFIVVLAASPLLFLCLQGWIVRIAVLLAQFPLSRWAAWVMPPASH